MKRITALVLLALVAMAGLYALAATGRESSYLEYIEKGDLALARDDSFAAIEAFGAAIALKPDSMAGHLKRGEAYRRRKEYESALRDLRRAANLDPLATYPQEILGDVNVAMGRYPRAAEHYTEYLTLDDRAPRVLYKLALARFESGQTALAAAALRRSINLDERSAAAHYLLGVCLRDLGKPADAISSLQRAVSLDGGFVQAREELASLYGRLNRHDQQNRQLEWLAKLDERGPREVALALGYARDGQVERAVIRLRNAARHFPDEAHTYTAVGRLWLERAERGGRLELDKTLEALETALADSPTSEALTLYGRALILSGELGRAQSVLMQATSRFPVDPLSFFYLAEVADERGQTAVAEQALIDYSLLEGIESPRLNATTLARVGEAQLKSGNPSAARRAVDRALRKDPSNEKALALRAFLR